MPEDQLLDLPGGTLFVRRWLPAHGAAAPGVPVLLLHDSLGSVAQWREFPRVLADSTSRMVFAYDRLGFGQSSPRTGRPSLRFIEEEAEAVFPRLRQALDLDRVVLLGHSVGAAMALATAARHPDTIEAVISIAAQAFVEARTLDGIRAAQLRFADSAQRARLARWHPLARADWVLDAWMGVWLDPARAGWTLCASLKLVQCPVLVIHGDRDEYGSAAFPQRIAALVRGPVQLQILDDTGHVPLRERKTEVLVLCADFLRRTRIRVALLQAWAGVGAQDDGHATIDTMLAAWSEPHRHYHTLQHLAECLDWMASPEVRALAIHPHEVVLALGFHDVVYDVHRHDSEQRSADLAAGVLGAAGVAPEAIARIVALVLDTRHDAAATTPDGALLVDIDLSILAAEAERFAEYDGQIRTEYAHVLEPDYRAARRRVLQRFLERTAVFATGWFQQRLEGRARMNLQAAVHALA